jgi:signal recognition particle receptor subunit beta
VAFTNFETKEIHCKVIYFGSSGSGKTENLRSVFHQTSAEIKSGLLELQEQDGSTRYFDFLPLSIGQLGDFQIRMHLFTLPVSTLYHSTSSIILRGVDGFVFVADSRVESLVDNVNALKSCRKILQDEGYNINDLATVIQYNKRDLQGVLPVALLRKELNALGDLDMEASATANFGTVECLESIARQIMSKLETSRKHPTASGFNTPFNSRSDHDDTDSLSD